MPNLQRQIIRPPKVFQAPRDEEESALPKIIKIGVLMLILILGLVYLFFFSAFFQIKNLDIVGTPSQNVKERLDKLIGKNIFSFSSKTLEEQVIAENQNYLSVRIFRGLPSTVRVKFEDREPKIIWSTNGQEYLVDKNGVLFQESSTGDSLPIVRDINDLPVDIPIQIATTNFVDFVKGAKFKLEEYGIQVSEFRIAKTTFQVEAITDKNYKIIMDTVRPLSEQMDALKLVLDKNVNNVTEYIDLRVEGWVYYK